MKTRVVVAVIIEKGQKILLGRKPPDIGPYPNTWVLPGGGVNLEEESLTDAMHREIKEETKIEGGTLRRLSFDEDYEPDKHGEMTHYVFLTYRLKCKQDDVIAGDDISRLEWINKKDLTKIPLARPSVKLFKELGWI
ncbi:MAG: NUDIX hydrolase [Patescibacteria group bacterium]